MKVYVFRRFRLSIIRSLFTVHSAMLYVIQVCRQPSSRTRMELEFHTRLIFISDEAKNSNLAYRLSQGVCRSAWQPVLQPSSTKSVCISSNLNLVVTPSFWRWGTMVHDPLMFLSEWREFPSAPCLVGKKNLMTARVSMLLKSRASPDILPFSLCNKKILAIQHMNRPVFPTTLSILSYDIGK